MDSLDIYFKNIEGEKRLSFREWNYSRAEAEKAAAKWLGQKE